MTGTINVTVMPVQSLVLNVRGVDCDFPRFLFGRLVDVLVGHGFCPAFVGQDFGDGLGEGCFSVIDVSDGSDVDVGFGAVECGGEVAKGLGWLFEVGV
jgi:hypothetical protein